MTKSMCSLNYSFVVESRIMDKGWYRTLEKYQPLELLFILRYESVGASIKLLKFSANMCCFHLSQKENNVDYPFMSKDRNTN